MIHFAGLKAVGESVAQPLRYWDVNVGGTMALLEVLERHGVRKIVFSSSATVYGEPERVPIDESAPVGATNPYGRTKQVIELLLGDVAGSLARLARRAAALLQPGRRPPERRHRRGPQRHPQQPHAVRDAGGGRPPRRARGLRRRLPHPRRHRASATTST